MKRSGRKREMKEVKKRRNITKGEGREERGSGKEGEKKGLGRGMHITEGGRRK